MDNNETGRERLGLCFSSLEATGGIEKKEKGETHDVRKNETHRFI